MKKNLI